MKAIDIQGKNNGQGPLEQGLVPTAWMCVDLEFWLGFGDTG